MNKVAAGRRGPRACRRQRRAALIICARRGRAGHQLRARGGGSPAESVTVDAARYVPSSSSNNKRATAVPSAPRHRTTAAAAATAFRVGDSCGRRRASAATVVGCGTSTAASARRWRGLGRIVRIVSAARRAQGTQRIVRIDCFVENVVFCANNYSRNAATASALAVFAPLALFLVCYRTLADYLQRGLRESPRQLKPSFAGSST